MCYEEYFNICCVTAFLSVKPQADLTSLVGKGQNKAQNWVWGWPFKTPEEGFDPFFPTKTEPCIHTAHEFLEARNKVTTTLK